jgi:tRNA A58 N-methylase Trm61
MKTSFLHIFSYLVGTKWGKLLLSNKGRLEDIKALNLLPPLGLSYNPWTGSALRPAAVRLILNEILINNRKTVVELGCGVSTLYLARQLSRVGGKLFSFDDNAGWVEIVRGFLDEMKIPPNVCRLVPAPLTETTLSLVGGTGNRWYDTDSIERSLSGETFDMVIVDGPEAWQKHAGFSRYPALPYLHRYLKDDFVVFLDDITRKGERKILKRWASDFSLDTSIYPEYGVGVLRRSTGPVFNIK